MYFLDLRPLRRECCLVGATTSKGTRWGWFLECGNKSWRPEPTALLGWGGIAGRNREQTGQSVSLLVLLPFLSLCSALCQADLAKASRWKRKLFCSPSPSMTTQGIDGGFDAEEQQHTSSPFDVRAQLCFHSTCNLAATRGCSVVEFKLFTSGNRYELLVTNVKTKHIGHPLNLHYQKQWGE